MCELNAVSVFKIYLLNLVPNPLFCCHFWSLIGTYFWGFESLIGLYKDPMCLRTLCWHSALYYVNMTVSQPFRHCWQTGDNLVNYVLGMWCHAMQLSTTLIPFRKFWYLLQCSAVDIQTHSFTVQTVPASLPAVRQYHPRLTHFWPFFVGNERFKENQKKT